MSTSYNEITGKAQKTKGSTDPYREGWDKIFGKKQPGAQPAPSTEERGSDQGLDVETQPLKP